MELWPIAILLVLFVINVPVAFAIGIAALSFFLLSGSQPVMIFVQRFVSVTHSFPLLAVPFFILAGIVMNHSGITSRLMRLAESLTGHMTGGLAQVNVVLSTLMGGMSGSANADAAMQSKMLVPEMVKRGYDKPFAAAVTASSAVIAPIIPPGIGLILYGFLADVSIGRLFLAGIVPGLLLCLALMAAVGWVSRRHGYGSHRAEKASAGERLTALKDSFWGLMIPVLIIGCIRLGVFTPSEAGAIAVVYAILVGRFVYGELHWTKMPAILVEAVQATAAVMLIICAAQALGFYMTWEMIPIQVANAMLDLTQDPIAMLLLINAMLLLIGILLEGSAALILLTPLLVPIIRQLGIDPVHFGVVLVLNLTIAGVTPPVGTLMYTACTVAGVKVLDFAKAVLPLLAVLIVVLLIVSLIPPIALTLPNLIYG